jgi:hypothetical protein
MLDGLDALELHKAGARHAVDGLAGGVGHQVKMEALVLDRGLDGHAQSSAKRGYLPVSCHIRRFLTTSKKFVPTVIRQGSPPAEQRG